MLSNTILFEKKAVRMVAHRGVSGLECENSGAAFVAAGNRSYYGIETDVHVTKDGKFVVIHDDRTGRVSDTDISVENSTYAQLCQVLLYSNVAKKLPGRRDLVIPTLSDYIRICKHYGKAAVLELKNRIQTEDIRRIIMQIRELEHLSQTIFISFSWENMLDLRQLLPEQKLQFLTAHWDDSLPEKLQQHGLDLDILYTELNPERIQLLHSRGIEVNCWTCDDVSAGEALAGAGIDYITSNILE